MSATLQGRQYLLRTSPPGDVPAGMVVVHNQIKARTPRHRLGLWGFRAWLEPTDSALIESCPCKWAKELGVHYRVKGLRS